MAPRATMTVITLLLFAFITPGLCGIKVNYKVWVNVTVGQNISLPCSVDEEHDIQISQIEWNWLAGNKDHEKIVVYHPLYLHAYYWSKSRITLRAVNSPKSGMLRGSVLLLHEVALTNSGDYVCEISSYPNGSIKKTTHLFVQDFKLSAEVTWPDGAVLEGDAVRITCVSFPPAERYKLWPSQNESSVLTSQNGEFNLPNLMRHNSGLYICQAERNTSVPSFQDHNTTVQLTVNYLDDIECNSDSSIVVDAGQNLTISCAANASQPLRYKWMKGNETVSHTDTLFLRSMSGDQAGVYTLTADSGNPARLHRQVEFSITVLTGLDTGNQTAPASSTADPAHLTPSTVSSPVNQTGEHLASTRLLATTGVTMRTVEPDPRSSVVPRDVTSTEGGVNVSSAAPPASDGTTGLPSSAEPGSEVNSTASISPLEGGAGTTSDPESPDSTAPASALPAHSTTTTPTASPSNTAAATTVTMSTVSGTEVNDNRRYEMLAVLPLLVLLVLIVWLYRRHLIQKRMDMPPPFKPPPPPVKYTSVRSQDIFMTDI